MILLAISLSAALAASGPSDAAALAEKGTVCAAAPHNAAQDRFVFWHNALRTSGERIDVVDLAGAAAAAGIPFEFTTATRIKRKDTKSCPQS